MRNSAIRIILLLASLILLPSCASKNTYHGLKYDQETNKNITLLKVEYSNYVSTNIINPEKGIYHLIHGHSRIGDYINIQWMEKSTSTIHQKKIEIKKGLPFNMSQADIILAFDEHNNPEVFVAYASPGTHLLIDFKNRTYIDRKIRRIYPDVNQVDISQFKRVKK